MSTRITAADRYRRILAMIPWIAERDTPSIYEVAERFGITAKQVVADLDVILLVGIPPYYPNDYIDVSYGTDTVSVRLGDHFNRPLRLTASEALSVLVSGAGLAALDADDDQPLSRALHKVRSALGVPDGTLEIDLGPADRSVLEQLRRAIDDSTVVVIDYYSSSTDSERTRSIEPHRLYAAEGHWYVAGRCRAAAGPRVFRVDRIRSITSTDEHFDAPSELPEATVFEASERARRIVLDLGAEVSWPWSLARPDNIERHDDGSSRVIVAVGGPAWLERVLIELGPDATVVEGVVEGSVTAAEAAEVRRGATERILARYLV